MSRGPRLFPPSGMLHLFSRSNNRVRIFRQPEDYEYFKGRIRKFVLLGDVHIQNYNLMPTHYHLLAWIDDTSQLSQKIKALEISYQYYFRRRYRYTGNLWHSRFGSIKIITDEQAMQCGRYIDINDVKAGVSSRLGEYRWSSYRHYGCGQSDDIVDDSRNFFHHFGNTLGERRFRYREFAQAGLELTYPALKILFEKKGLC